MNKIAGTSKTGKLTGGDKRKITEDKKRAKT